MATIITGADGIERAQLDDGSKRRLGLNAPDKAKLMALPSYVNAYPIIPTAAWPKKSADDRHLMPFVEDQNGFGSCGGHGASAAETAAFNRQFFVAGKPSIHLSPVFLYGLCNGGSDNGSSPDDLRAAMIDKGCCTIDTVPEGHIYSRTYSQAAYAEAQRYRADQVLMVHTFEEYATAVQRGHALFPGIFCGSNFNPDRNGRLPQWDGKRVGGHCIGGAGPIEHFDDMGWGAWILNSWSKTWGLNGWAWMPRSYFDGGLPVFGAGAIVSVLPDPQSPGVVPATV